MFLTSPSTLLTLLHLFLRYIGDIYMCPKIIFTTNRNQYFRFILQDGNDELRRSPGTPVFTAPECCLGYRLLFMLALWNV